MSTSPENPITAGMWTRLRRDARVCFNLTLHGGTIGRVSEITRDGKSALFKVAGMALLAFEIPCKNLVEIPNLYGDMAEFLGLVSMGFYESRANLFKVGLEAAFRTDPIPRDTRDMLYELARMAAFDPQDPKVNYRVLCMAYHRELEKLTLPRYTPPPFPWARPWEES